MRVRQGRIGRDEDKRSQRLPCKEATESVSRAPVPYWYQPIHVPYHRGSHPTMHMHDQEAPEATCAFTLVAQKLVRPWHITGCEV